MSGILVFLYLISPCFCQTTLISSAVIRSVFAWIMDNLKKIESFALEKSRNGDTLGPVKLIVWPEQGNQGDWREQDDQGEVSIIIFGMSKSSGFQKYSICWVFQALCLCLCLCRCLCHCLCHCLCLCICVLLWFFNKLMYVYRGSVKLMSREKMTQNGYSCKGRRLTG